MTAQLLTTENQLASSFLATGIQLLKAAQYEAALVDFNSVLEFDPDNRYAHWNKAMCLLLNGAVMIRRR